MLVGMFAACSSTRNSAPVVERTPVPVKPVEAAKPVVPVVKPPPKMADVHGFYTVKRGDTLLQIALEFGQNYRDIISWNNLANPNDIKVDQVLRVLPPEGAAQVAAVVAPDVKPVAPQLPAGPNKTLPRGDKRVFSDAALVEMQKPDSGAVAVIATPVKPDNVKPNDIKPSDKPIDNASTEEESVSWMWPTDGKIVNTYEDGKKGIDIAGNSGQAVLAAGAGRVTYAGSGIRGYGNLVIVKHTGSPFVSAYAHNKTILVKEGQTVTKGQKIAEMGSSDSDGVKLHFEIRQQGKPVDPAKYLPGR